MRAPIHLALLPALLVMGGAAGCDAGESEPAADPPPAASDRYDPEHHSPERFDWLLEGGTLVDGTGAPARPADVLLAEGRIAHVADAGALDPDTLEIRERFDARGLVVTPGFIDSHAHGNPVDAPDFPNFLAQGVTTVVLGQDGGGPGPEGLAERFEALDGASPAVNVAYLAGHNTIRRRTGVGYGEADADGRRRMAEAVEEALELGAFGLSTGLEYDPGTQADMEELVAIARPVAEAGGVVMSHMRDEDTGVVLESVEELLEQGRASGARVHASHLKVVLGHDPAEAREVLEAMAAAREEGVEVTGDVYPYVASFTGLALLFPDWARPPNDYDEVVAERRDELADYLRERVEGRNGPEATLFGTGDLAGRTLAEVARERDRPFEEVLVDLGPGGARAAYFVMEEAVMETFLLDPYVAVSSDGSPTMLHPRGYGAFARVIRRYVVEEEALALEEAVRKMSALPAAVVGLDDPDRVAVPRGRVQEGWAADLAAFDPEEVRDRAHYEDPHRTAEGMRAVWVDGNPAWWDGEPADGPRRGSLIRAGAEADVTPGPTHGAGGP